MKRVDQSVINLRIVIEQPVVGVLHSLQAKDDSPLDPKKSRKGEALVFDFQIRVGPGPKFFGDQVRLLDRAAGSGKVIETTVIGTDKDGTPTCATVRPTARRIVGR
jgi:hypothetical protein